MLGKGTRLRVLCFGDSLTEGYVTFCLFHPYANVLQDKLDAAFPHTTVEVVPAGLSGDCAVKGFMKRLLPIVKTSEPFDYAVILGGTNDLARSDPDTIYEALAECHQTCLSHNTKHTIAVTIPETIGGWRFPDINLTRTTVNQRLAEELVPRSGKHTSLLDLSDELPQPYHSTSENWVGDGLHMTEAGYDRFGGMVFEAIRAHVMQGKE